MKVVGTHTIIEGFEFDGNTDIIPHWELLTNLWDFTGTVNDAIYPVGDIAINVTTGQYISVRDNYFHDLVQKAINIEAGRYVDFYNNIIDNVATTSLSGGHAIMRQQGAHSNFGDADISGDYRWDIYGNLLQNVEQRIYSWVPSKGYMNMTLDEGKPINIDETTDTQMTARIAQNIIAYSGIDAIRLKTTPNLSVEHNSIYSYKSHADGITDSDTVGLSIPFPGLKVKNNLVQTGPGTLAFELNDGFPTGSATGTSEISGNIRLSSGGGVNPSNLSGVGTSAGFNGSLFVDPLSGDFAPIPGLEGIGVSLDVRNRIASLAASFGAGVVEREWNIDHLRSTQTILDNIPGLRDGNPTDGTVFNDLGIYATSTLEPTRKAIYFGVNETWRTTNNVSNSTLNWPGTAYDGRYQIILPSDFSDWYDTTLTAYKRWDGSAYNGGDFTEIAWGASLINQPKMFSPTVLSVFKIDSPSTFTQTTSTSTVQLDGEILLDLSNFNTTGNQTIDLISATSITGSYSHLRAIGANGKSLVLNVIDGASTDVLQLSISESSQGPTDIAISSQSIAENAGNNAIVGTLSTTTSGTNTTFTYTLVSGSGDTDNASFNIDGSSLRATSSFDFETKSSYTVRVRSTDQAGLNTEKSFVISVKNSGS